MRQTTISERSSAGYRIAQTFWIIAGFILVLAVGDVVIVLALALAAVAATATWWIRRNAGQRAQSGDAALASVTHLPTSQREPKRASAHRPWHRNSAA
jgi:hypothetical protein